jgi:hypothetical protein
MERSRSAGRETSEIAEERENTSSMLDCAIAGAKLLLPFSTSTPLVALLIAQSTQRAISAVQSNLAQGSEIPLEEIPEGKSARLVR